MAKVVYTASALVEQTTPDAAELLDTESVVEELAFLDEASWVPQPPCTTTPSVRCGLWSSGSGQLWH